MHELSIAMSIVEMAEEESANRGGVRINAVYLRLGPLAGVVKEALLFSWEAACAETPLQATRLVIEEVPLKAFCAVCQAAQTLSSIQCLRCPVCGAPAPDLRQGRELEVVALELAS